MSKLLWVFIVLALLLIPVQILEAQNNRIIVFAPHPDDDIIGCGGSIAKHIQNGKEVTIVYLTSGDSGSLSYSKENLAKLREEEAANGAKVLGTKNLIFLKNPDGYLEANKDNLIKVTKIIRQYQPSIVYLPHNEEGHRDHRVTNEIVLNAVGRAKGEWFQEVGEKPWSVSTVLSYEVHPPLREANYCEDITDYIDSKIKALQEHKSQINNIEYDRGSKALAAYRGTMSSSFKYAECFHIVETDKVFY
jgi:N-acetylglucosamine malate deacetylase 1